MPATTTDPRTSIADAVKCCRDSRHHSSCRCFMYRDINGAGFCSAQESLWARAINRLIDDCR